MNKTYLLSAIAFGALTITWMPVAAQADTSTCTRLSGQALQQRINAGKCDAVTHLSPEMIKALALAEKGNKGGDEYLDPPVTEAGEEPGDEAGDEPGDEEAKNGGGEPNKGSGSEDGGDAGNGGGKQKKLPGDKIVMKQPGGEVNIGDKPVVKKQPKDGDVIIAEEIEELEFGTPEHDPAIAEEIEVLVYGTPEHEPAIAEEVDDLVLADPKDPVKTLAEPEGVIKTMKEPEGSIKTMKEPKDKQPALLEKIGDLFFGVPVDGKAAFSNGRDGKDGNDGKADKADKADKGSNDSKGPKGGNGIAG